MNNGILVACIVTVFAGFYVQVDGQTSNCILKNQICTRNAFDSRPCCNSQGPPCPPNTRVNCRFIRCRERYGQKEWHWFCLHWNYYSIYNDFNRRRSVPLDDYEFEESSKRIGSGGGSRSSRSLKLAELQQEIIEQLNKIENKDEETIKLTTEETVESNPETMDDDTAEPQATASEESDSATSAMVAPEEPEPPVNP